MNKYLLEILKIENTVIIPGIGALMVTNNKTGTLMFNPHLKFNDKTLEKYVEENSNMDAQESANFVSKYAREILSELDKGEAYTIFGLGKFVKNGDEIEFTFDTSSAPKETEEKVVTPAPVKEKKTETKPVEKKEVKKEPKKEKKKKEEKDIVVTPPINNPFEEKKPTTPNTFKEAKEEQPKEPETKKEEKVVAKTETPQKEEKTVVPPVVPVPTKTATTEEKKEALNKAGMAPQKAMEKTQKDKKPKKKKRLVWLILLLLLIGSGAYIGVNWDVYQHRLGLSDTHTDDAHDKEDKHSDKNKAKESDKHEDSAHATNENDSNSETIVSDSSSTANETAVESDENIEPEIKEEPVVEEAPVKVVESSESFESNGSTGGNGDYHVVVGLFSNPSNAEGLVAKLKADGHNGLILGTFDNLQMVVVKSFPSRDAAIESMREIRGSIEDRAWVFRY